MAYTPPNLRNAEADRKALRLNRLKSRRKLWLQAHLYLGLIAGLILAIIGLTGSILVYWAELDQWLNPSLLTAAAPKKGRAAYRPFAEIAAAAENAKPAGAEFYAVIFPRHEDSVFCFWYKASVGADENQTYPNVFVDPYTAKVTGTREFYPASLSLDPKFLMGFVFDLHYMLFLKRDIGMFVVGILAVVFMVSVLTGLIVWWPLTGNWRQALTLKMPARPERFVFDLHKTTGFYTAIVLLAVLMSGISMNLATEFQWLVSLFSPLRSPFDFKSTPSDGMAGLTLADIVEQKRDLFSEGRLHGIYAPADSAGAYVADIRDIPNLKRYVVDRRMVAMEQYTGNVLNIADPTTGSGGDVFLQWQWPLHSGQAFGNAGRIMVFLSGLACPVLYVTGVIRWLHKRRSARFRGMRSPGAKGAITSAVPSVLPKKRISRRTIEDASQVSGFPSELRQEKP